MESKKRGIGRGIMAGAAVVMAILMMKVISYIASPQKNESGMVETLKKLENQDSSEIQKAILDAEVRADGNENATADIAKRDYKTLFEHSLIIGEGLPERIRKTKCVAQESFVSPKKGKTFMRHPDTVFILQGYKDVCAGRVTVKDYSAMFEKNISVIKEEYPEARIFICLLPNPKKEAVESNPNLKKVAGYNSVMETAAREKNIPVIDLSSMKSTPEYRFKEIHIKMILNRMAGEADL